MNKPKIYFRADGNAQVGLGHVFRSLALAEMLGGSFDCHFIIHNPLPILKTQILAVCQSIIELPETDDFTKETTYLLSMINKNEIIVLDGYHFVTDYQKAFKNHGIKIVCIDDIYAYHFVADAVINHAGGLQESDFSKEEYTNVHHGLKYALLRKPFRIAVQERTYNDNKDNDVFICFGGADPKNDTLKAIQKCENKTFINKCFVILGGAYQYRSTLESYIQKSALNIEILSNLSAQEMVNYMKKCNYAITPPSSVAYEYLSVGGLLFLKIIADNQAKMYDFFINENIAFSLNDFSEITEKQEVFNKQAQCFDGKQKERFLKIFKNL